MPDPNVPDISPTHSTDESRFSITEMPAVVYFKLTDANGKKYFFLDQKKFNIIHLDDTNIIMEMK